MVARTVNLIHVSIYPIKKFLLEGYSSAIPGGRALPILASSTHERGTFFRFQVYQRVGNFHVNGWELLHFLSINEGSLIKMFRKTRLMAIQSTFPNSNSTRNQVDEEPLCGCATSLNHYITSINFSYVTQK